MNTKMLLGVFVLLLAANGHALQTRLVIGDDGTTVVEVVCDVNIAAAGVGEISLPLFLPPQAITESVVLQEVSETPKVKILSHKLYIGREGGDTESRRRTAPSRWTVDAPEPGMYTFKLTYLHRGLIWDGAYNIILTKDMSAMKIQGVIAIQNITDRGFRDPEIVLARRRGTKRTNVDGYLSNDGTDAPQSASSGNELLVLGQVALLEASSITNTPLFDIEALPVTPFLLYRIDARARERRIESSGAGPNIGVWWRMEVPNTEEYGLGVDLPKGSIRVYQQLEEGTILLSSGNIEDTYPGQSFGLNLAYEPGITVRSTLAASRTPPIYGLYTYTLSSDLDDTHEVRVVLHSGGLSRQDVSITEASDLYKTHADGTIEFRVEVTPDTDKVITYKAAM